MPRINRLKILSELSRGTEEYKKCQIRIQAHKNITFFCGENGSGKSTLLGMANLISYKLPDRKELFDGLSRSKFRSRFHLSDKEKAYISEKSIEEIRKHAEDFVVKRLSPENPDNDGKQTPMRGHPVFVAQHATGCCCRGCLEKWHHIPAGKMLNMEEQEYVVDVLMEWIKREIKSIDK